MNECPECGGLLIQDVDDDLYSSTPSFEFFCPGCGWCSSDEPDDNDNEICPSCGGREDNHNAACSEDDAIWY